MDNSLSIDKTFLKEKYLCKDNIYRKAFRIKGHSNTIFVTYKRQLTKASSILPKNNDDKKKQNNKKWRGVGGGDEFDFNSKLYSDFDEKIKSTIQNTITLITKTDSQFLGKFKKQMLEIEKYYELNENNKDIGDLQKKNFIGMVKIFILNGLLNTTTKKIGIDNFFDDNSTEIERIRQSKSTNKIDTTKIRIFLKELEQKKAGKRKTTINNNINNINNNNKPWITKNKWANIAPTTGGYDDMMDIDVIVTALDLKIAHIIELLNSMSINDDYNGDNGDYGIYGNFDADDTPGRFNVIHDDNVITDDTLKTCFKLNISSSTITPIKFTNGIHYYFQGINKDSDDIITREYSKSSFVNTRSINIPSFYKLECSIINNYKGNDNNDDDSSSNNTRWFKIDLTPNFVEIRIIEIRNIIASLLNTCVNTFDVEFLMSEQAVLLLDTMLKHILLCFPEMLIVGDLSRDLNEGANSVYNTIKHALFTDGHNYTELLDPVIPIRFRQFRRPTCWAASTMNLLYILESKGVVITGDSWLQNKDSLDVNKFGYMIINKKDNILRPFNVGHDPYLIWTENKFNVDIDIHVENLKVFTTDNDNLEYFKSLFLIVNKNQDRDIYREVVSRLNHFIETMSDMQVSIVVFKTILGPHCITIHKINAGNFEIHDSNFLFAHKSTTGYIMERFRSCGYTYDIVFTIAVTVVYK